MLPYREPAPNHPLRSSGVTPAPCPISEPPNPIQPPSYAPAVHNPLSLPSLPLSGSPRTGASNWWLRPRDNNGSAVPKWCQITMLFNGKAKPGNGGKNKQWTLKAQSVHQRWRKVSFNNGVAKLFQQKQGRSGNLTTLPDKYIVSNFSLIPAASGSVHGCFRARDCKMPGFPFNPIKNFHPGYNPPEYAVLARPTACNTISIEKSAPFFPLP